MSIYGDWVISQMLKQKYTQENATHTRNSLDFLSRWLIEIYNAGYTISSPDKSYNSIMGDFKVRNLPGAEKMIETIRTLSEPLYYEYPYKFSGDTFCCHNFSVTLPRLPKLLALGGEKHTATMLLQYATIMIVNGNFWSITHDDYKKLQKKHNATVEGFASPLNSQFLLMDLPYCSVLPIDKHFGSRGSFFEQDFAGETVICNPPFDNNFMLTVVKFIEKSAGSFVVVVPTRPGIAYYDLLIKMGPEEIWHSGKYYYEHNETKILATFDTSVFTISRSSRPPRV